MNIPIVVVAYNRACCLDRLLKSLNKAFYYIEIKLIISIDGGGTEDVINMADSFHWKHGVKEVIIHSKNLGLRNHILQCGRLSRKYDGIILLEDDLYVAPHFYNYIIEIKQFYKNSIEVAGFALYSHGYNETACLPFVAFEDGFDVFFMQLACSWGQCWLSHQWNDFDEWYENNKTLDLMEDESIPPDVRLWPDSSWKKYMIKYLVDKQKYFVYPRVSYSTNFGDAGEHHNGTKLFQVPLQHGRANHNLPKFDESIAKYDSFCEIFPESIKINNPELREFDFDVDIYGYKKNIITTNQYVLTTRECHNPAKSYSRSLKPHEVNVMEASRGEEICLARKDDVSDYDDYLMYRINIYAEHEYTQSYYYSLTPMHYYYLNSEIEKYRNGYASEIEKIRNSYASEIEKIRNSYSFRVGHSLIKPFSIIKKSLKQFKEG